ncbi:MAG: hypothetical protein AAF602_03330 [Myxococcota bacterium]
MEWLPLIGSALLSGFVAVLVTLAIERFGGVVGGVLGTLPTTIVPASLGIGWSDDGAGPVFAAAMATVPVGMLINAGFLWLWRVLPARLPRTDLRTRLTLMVVLSVAGWALLAVPTMTLLHAIAAPGVAFALGAVTLAANALAGALASRRKRPAPKGRRPVGPGMLLARGGLAAVAVGLATAVAQTGDGVLAGVLSVFPAIFLTTMVGLWLAQDAAVPAGAIGPMMLGSTAVGGYALAVTLVAPWLGIVGGALVAWVLAVALCTLPAFAWLRKTQLRTPG